MFSGNAFYLSCLACKHIIYIIIVETRSLAFSLILIEAVLHRLLALKIMSYGIVGCACGRLMQQETEDGLGILRVRPTVIRN